MPVNTTIILTDTQCITMMERVSQTDYHGCDCIQYSIKRYTANSVEYHQRHYCYVGLGPLSNYTINQLSRNLKIHTNCRQKLIVRRKQH